MSQLVNSVQAFDTGDRKILRNKKSRLFEDLVKLESQIFEEKTDYIVAKIYKIGVKFGSQVMVTETELLSNPNALEFAINNTKKSIAEAVFGEFRPLIRQIYDALYDYDVEKARFVLSQLEDQMFEVDNETK